MGAKEYLVSGGNLVKRQYYSTLYSLMMYETVHTTSSLLNVHELFTAIHFKPVVLSALFQIMYM